MKTRAIIFISLIGLIVLNSCRKPKSEMTMCENLSKQGNHGISALAGEWGFESFAYTRNGKRIQNEEALFDTDKNSRYISITDTGTLFFYHLRDWRYTYSISNNVNGIVIGEKKYNGYISPNDTLITIIELPYSPEEEKIEYILEHAQCYTVKKNKLYIHYTEKDEKNVFILTKK